MQSTIATVQSLIDSIDASSINNDASESKYNGQEQELAATKTKGKVVIFGSGLIGLNWAVLFSRANYTVVLYDIKQEQLDIGLNSIITEKLPAMKLNNLLYGQSVKSIANRISCTMDLKAALTNAILVQECVPESIKLKQKVLKIISDTLNELSNGDQCIISSSTSTIVPSILVQTMTVLAQNVIVSHPVNPPMCCPVIELCAAPKARPNLVSDTRKLMVDIGLKPCVLKKESQGFVLNRLQYGLLQAAFQLIEDGVATAEDIDATVKYGLGLRWSFMGPFETIHLNAPKGVLDYGERYAELCMSSVMKTIPNNMQFKDSTWQSVHDQMSARIPVESLPDRCKWRDDQLLGLAVHQKEMQQKTGK